MTISTRQYAQLAQHSYDPPEITADGERPFVVADGVRFNVLKSVDKPSGYQGTIFQRQDTGEIVVAHRGSEFDRQPFEDGLIADGGMVANRANKQLKDALTLTDEASEMARGMAPKYGQAPQVTVTGHSLGGCLTQLTAAKRGLNGEAFNPYGAVSLNQNIPEGGTQVINHVMAGDVVSAASKHFGKVQMYAEPVELNVLKASGYEDNGSQWDIRNPGKAAVIGGDSHRMHHFLDTDINGQPDRSILSQPQALELAEKHRPMFDKYRSDIEMMRGGVSIGAGVTRGAQGIAEEIGRLLPEKPAENPFKDAHGAIPTGGGPLDPRQPGHPDHPMHEKIKTGVQSVYSQHAMAFEDNGERTVAASLANAKLGGLKQADHIVAGNAAKSGIDIFVVEGDLRDPGHKRSQVNTDVAAKVPVEESFQKIDAANQRQTQVTAQDQAQEQNRGASIRTA